MLEFSTQDEAIRWMVSDVNDPCIDNQRFAYVDDQTAVAEYMKRQSKGCCGSYDEYVLVGGRKAMIGCNYGH